MNGKTLVFAVMLLFSISSYGQILSSSNKESSYSVGFKTILLSDTSRQFKFKNQSNPVNRPIRFFIWYPTKKVKKANFMIFEKYVYASDLKKDADQLTDSEKSEIKERLIATLEYFEVKKEQLENLMKAQTNAIADAPELNKKFPLLVLGNVGEGFYYSSLAEFLASNGYVVVSLPSLGANEDERCGFDSNCLKNQQSDMEFALEKMNSLANIDASKIGLVAWSFSGLAIAHLQTENPNIKTVISLDAATGYQYGKDILEQSKKLEINKTNVPFLHFQSLGGNSKVPKNFDFFNAYQAKEKRLVTFKNLQHSDFISLYGKGVRYAKKENDQKALEAIGLVNLLTLNFLNAYLNKNLKSLKFVSETMKNNNAVFLQENAPNLSVRNAHALVYDENLNKTILFGGADSEKVLNDTWEFNGEKWFLISTNNSPPPRTFPSMTYDSVRKKILLFGGNRVLFGKDDNDYEFFNDFWEFDGKTWTKIDVPTPDGRAEASFTYDRQRQKAVLFGGYRIENGTMKPLSDTWEWNGKSWQKMAEGIPTARSGAAIAYDKQRKKTVLFGGGIKSGGANETWEWDGKTWREIKSAQTEPRYNSTMVYDESRGKIIRFGGWDGTKRVSETWEFDGTNWTKLNIESPDARNHAVMVYDMKRQKIILFGGHNGDFVFGDTWEFDGAGWKKIISVEPQKRIENNH